MIKRKTSLCITKENDGSFLVKVSFSEEDGYPKKDTETIAELISALDDSPFAGWKNSHSVTR